MSKKKPIKKKAKGSRAERRAKKLLLENGYDFVIKAGGSLGPFDLVAIDSRQALVSLIQVKSNRTATVKERAAMIAVGVPTFCVKEMWIFTNRIKFPTIVKWIDNCWVIVERKWQIEKKESSKSSMKEENTKTTLQKRIQKPRNLDSILPDSTTLLFKSETE